jgi:hypothetical protein
LRDGRCGDDEAVAIVVQDKAAFDFVAGHGVVRGFGRGFIGPPPGLRQWLFFSGLSLGEAVTAAGEFFDGVTFFELGKDFEQGAAIGFSQVQTAGDIIGGGGFAFNLQKTQ